MLTRTATATAVLLAAGLTLAACSSSSNHHNKLAATATQIPTTITGLLTPTTAPPSEVPIPDSPLAKGAHTAACWKAIRSQYAPGTAQLTGAPTEPPECADLTSDEISAVAEDVLAHQFDN